MREKQKLFRETWHLLREEFHYRAKWVWSAYISALVIVVLLSPGAVLAHAVLLKVTPSGGQTLAQAPGQVQLLFSEALDPNFSSAQVRDADGARVDVDDSHVDANNDELLVTSLRAGLPSGVYTVFWRSLSAIDVHPDAGEYRLFVGVPVSADAAAATAPVQNTATPAATLGRWWFYLAASLFGGVLAMWKVVIGPLLLEPAVRDKVLRRAYRVILAGGVFLIVGTLFSAVAQAASAANVPLLDAFGKPLTDLLLRGRFASIWWPRLGLEVASLLLIAFAGIEGLASECALATLPAVLLTSALTSHGAALPGGGAPGIAIDWLHIVGAAAWVGGLAGLVMVLSTVRAANDGGVLLRGLISRFGRFALVASMTVLLSGVIQGALEVGNWTAILATLYGQLLLVKVVLLVGMLLLAAFNQMRGLGRGVRAELALGVLVLGVAAMLSGTPPTPNG